MKTQTPTTPQKNQHPNAVTTAQPANQLKLAGNFNFTADEVKGGIDDGGAGYVDQYPFLVKLSLDEFQVIDTRSGEGHQVWAGKELPCVIFYGHSVYRLHRGTVEGQQGEFENWPEDMKELVAQSLGSPFGDVQKSRGDFDAKGYSQYLDNKELRKDVSKRLYVILRLPAKITGGELALGTFGGSALKPFQGFVNTVKGMNAPLPLIKAVIGTKNAESQTGKAYRELTFRPMTDEAGNVATTVGNELEYREKILPTLNKIIETHQYAMKRVENSSSAAERPVASAARRIAAPAPASAANFEPSPNEPDEIPSGAFADEEFDL